MLPIFILEINEPSDRQFVAELYYDYSVSLLRIAQKMIGDQEAEDILCETFLEVIRRVQLLKTLSKPARYGYIVHILRSRAINRINILNKQQKLIDSEEESIDEITSTQETPEETVLRHISYEEAGALLAQVGEPYRTALVMKFFQRLDDKTIGKNLNISSQSVRVYVGRAKEKLVALAQKERLYVTK